MQPPVRVGIGLIRRGRFYLIRQRPAGSIMAGYWEFPGGKCEPGESTEAATQRECLEETGLQVVSLTLRQRIDHEYPHARVEMFYYNCETAEPDAEPGPKTGFRWVSAVELSKLNFPGANGPILDALAREADSG